MLLVWFVEKEKKKEKSLSSRMRLNTDHINTTLLAAAQAAYIHKPIEYFPSGNYLTLHHQTKQSRAEQTEHRIGFNSALNRKPNPTQTQPKRQSDKGRTDADWLGTPSTGVIVTSMVRKAMHCNALHCMHSLSLFWFCLRGYVCRI